MDNLSAKIIELSQGVYVIPGNTNVGVITSYEDSCTQVYLIDSGCTEIDGEYVLDVIKAFFKQEEKEFKIKALISTHCHADHIGGHNYIKDECHCQIYASKHERGCMETPMIQCTTLWGGYPPHEFRTLYFKPQETEVDIIIGQEDSIPLSDNRTLTFMELNGHSYQEIVPIITNNDGRKVLFAGDAIFPRGEILEHWIPLIANPVEFMDSLDKLCAIENVDWCIPGHGDFLSKNILEAAEMNKIAIMSTRMAILDALKNKKKMTCEEIVKYVADKNNMEMTMPQWAMVGSSVRSYLAVMHDAREIRMKVEKNLLYFYIEEKKETN